MPVSEEIARTAAGSMHIRPINVYLLPAPADREDEDDDNDEDETNDRNLGFD